MIKTKKLLARTAGFLIVAAPAAAMADGTSDPLAAASTQITTWTPIVGTLLVAAFGIAVLFKGLKLGKRGISSV